MYKERVKVGPICWALGFDAQYCISPEVRKVLACRSRDGDTVAGRVVERLVPDVVIARFMSGTASSIRSSNLFISSMMILSSASF